MTYLERMKAILSEKTLQEGTDKTDKSPSVGPSVGFVGFVGFVGDRGKRFCDDESATEGQSGLTPTPYECNIAASPDPADFFDHRCTVCGQPARFGYDVCLLHGELGRWFCAAHRPEAGRA